MISLEPINFLVPIPLSNVPFNWNPKVVSCVSCHQVQVRPLEGGRYFIAQHTMYETCCGTTY